MCALALGPPRHFRSKMRRTSHAVKVPSSAGMATLNLEADTLLKQLHERDSLDCTWVELRWQPCTL
eukprot:1875633-Amphidinium_carterae.1